jgi:hypothetical protein
LPARSRAVSRRLVFFDDLGVGHRRLEAVEAVDPLGDQAELEVLCKLHRQLRAVDHERPRLHAVPERRVEVLLGFGVRGRLDEALDRAVLGGAPGDVLLGRVDHAHQRALDAVDEDGLLLVVDSRLREDDLLDVGEFGERRLLVQLAVVVVGDDLRDGDGGVVLEIE